jgi:predicted anti-sigma-YlaC factor YlaD
LKPHSDICSLFISWFEQTLDTQAGQEVEAHLGECDACKQYFEAMSAALRPVTMSQGRLEPDPYLPTRISALAKGSAAESPSGMALIVRWSLRTVVFAAALLVGIYMGEQLSVESSSLTEEHIISEYSIYLGEIGIGERWQTVAISNEGVSK